MIKPAWRTLEGQLVTVVMVVCGTVVMQLTGIDTSAITSSIAGVSPDDLNSMAKTVDDVVKIYHASQTAPAELAAMGKFGGVLFFMYKLLTYFVGRRMDLKKNALETVTKIKELRDV